MKERREKIKLTSFFFFFFGKKMTSEKHFVRCEGELANALLMPEQFRLYITSLKSIMKFNHWKIYSLANARVYNVLIFFYHLFLMSTTASDVSEVCAGAKNFTNARRFCVYYVSASIRVCVWQVSKYALEYIFQVFGGKSRYGEFSFFFILGWIYLIFF